MRTFIRKSVLLTGAMLSLITAGLSGAQTIASHGTPAGAGPFFGLDLAVTYAPEYARVTYGNCSCFWMQGVSGEGALNFYRGLGVAAEVSQAHAAGIQQNVDTHKLSFVAGPRYTLVLGKRGESAHTSRIFAEGLLGVAHAYDGLFPTSAGVTHSATSAAIQAGGGYDLGLGRRFGLRAAEVDWVRSSFPNGASNVQNDLRLAVGVSYHLGNSR